MLSGSGSFAPHAALRDADPLPAALSPSRPAPARSAARSPTWPPHRPRSGQRPALATGIVAQSTLPWPSPSTPAAPPPPAWTPPAFDPPRYLAAARSRPRPSARYLDRNVPLAELASVARLSQFHLARYFKRAFGEAPVSYHRALRLQRAARFLAAGNGSVAQAAELIGYSDAVALSHAFRRHFGVPPQRYAIASRDAA